jgi:hypothetical protein
MRISERNNIFNNKKQLIDHKNWIPNRQTRNPVWKKECRFGWLLFNNDMHIRTRYRRYRKIGQVYLDNKMYEPH